MNNSITKPTLVADNPGMKDAAAIRRYVLAGNSIFTVRSMKTGTRFTYKVSRRYDHKLHKRAEEGPFFVSYFVGGSNDNDKDYQYIGMITEERGWHLTRASAGMLRSSPVLAFSWLWRQVISGDKNPEQADLEFFHSGRCGRCGRTLTVPESIESGMGPECASRGFGF